MPITIAVMNKLRAVWLPLNQVVHPFSNVLYWAAACTAFFGFLRLGEVFPKSAGEAPPLQLRDLSTDSPSFIKLLIRRLKTDPFGRGSFVVLGKSGHATCPVAALRSLTPPDQGSPICKGRLNPPIEGGLHSGSPPGPPRSRHEPLPVCRS